MLFISSSSIVKESCCSFPITEFKLQYGLDGGAFLSRKMSNRQLSAGTIAKQSDKFKYFGSRVLGTNTKLTNDWLLDHNFFLNIVHVNR